MYIEYTYLTVLAPVVSPQNEIFHQVSWYPQFSTMNKGMCGDVSCDFFLPLIQDGPRA